MIRILLLALTFGAAAAQVNVTPSSLPHQTFVDNSGSPCAGCSLYSYVAGTTTPQPTYTSSAGVSQNTNPIVLDIAGGANIWVASSLSYKFSLIDALGTTVWTVDNVKGSGGSGLPCATAYAIQYSNSSATALACDPTIKINPSTHAIEVGGQITGPFFAMRNLSTIAASWTFDITTPSTALASLGIIPYSALPSQTADTALMNATNATAKPAAVPLPTGCTGGINYSTVTHSYTCIGSGTITLPRLAVQAADTVVMNASSSSASPTAVPMPSGCTNGTNYSTVTHTWSCIVVTPLTCSGTTPPWTCYRVSADGTIEQFGIVLASTTGSTTQTVSITFPLSFTTQEALTVSGGGTATGGNDAYTIFHTGLSNSGATAVIRCAVNIGGTGCTSISQQIPVNWHALGK